MLIVTVRTQYDDQPNAGAAQEWAEIRTGRLYHAALVEHCLFKLPVGAQSVTGCLANPCINVLVVDVNEIGDGFGIAELA